MRVKSIAKIVHFAMKVEVKYDADTMVSLERSWEKKPCDNAEVGFDPRNDSREIFFLLSVNTRPTVTDLKRVVRRGEIEVSKSRSALGYVECIQVVEATKMMCLPIS